MNLTLVAYLAVAASLFGSGFGTAWKLQAMNITQIRLDQANERISIQRQARTALEQSMQRVSTAQTQAANRALRAAADNSRAIADLSRLRTTSASALRSAAGDLATCTASLASHSIVVGKCSQEVVRLASDLDDWAGSVILYQDAWPK